MINFVNGFVEIILCDKMLYFRNELHKTKYSTYQLNKANKKKKLFKVDNVINYFSSIEKL